MIKVRTQVPALAALVDFWWQGVQQDVAPFLLSPPWRPWGHACLLPMVYWDCQVARTRCRRRKAERPAANPQEMLSKQEMRGAADWEKLSQALDNPQDDEIEHQRFSLATFVGVNFPLLKAYFGKGNRCQFVEPSGRDDPAQIDDRDVRAKSFDDFQNM